VRQTLPFIGQVPVVPRLGLRHVCLHLISNDIEDRDDGIDGDKSKDDTGELAQFESPAEGWSGQENYSSLRSLSVRLSPRSRAGRLGTSPAGAHPKRPG